MSSNTPVVPAEAAAAFTKIEPELADLRPDEIARVNLDIPRAVGVAVAAVPHIASLRPQIAAELPALSLRHIDEVGTYALGAWYAHVVAYPEAQGGHQSPEVSLLLEEAAAVRERLLVGAEALAHAGHLDPGAVATIRSGKGHVDRASDLVALAALYHGSWDRISQKTAVERGDVDRAAELGPKILVALGGRERPTGAASPSDPLDRRARAFTLFARAYDTCRRAIHHLRWNEGDADTIVPSLFATRTRKPIDPTPAPEPTPGPEPDDS